MFRVQLEIRTQNEGECASLPDVSTGELRIDQLVIVSHLYAAKYSSAGFSF